MSEGILHNFSVMCTLLFCFIFPLPKDGRLFCPVFPLWPWCFAVCAFSNSSSVTAKTPDLASMCFMKCDVASIIINPNTPSHARPDLITSGFLLGNPSLCGGFADNNAWNDLWAMKTDRRWITCHSGGCPDQGNNQVPLSIIIISPWLSLFLGLVSSSASVLKACWKTSRENMK